MSAQTLAFSAFLALALLLLAVSAVLAFALGRSRGREEAASEFRGRFGEERRDAVRRSRATLVGLAAEQLAPWLPGFPWDPTEVRFVGKPVDFVVFRGAALGEVKEVILVEVKSGAAAPSRVERSLRDAVRAGRVSWAEWRPQAPQDAADSGDRD